MPLKKKDKKRKTKKNEIEPVVPPMKNVHRTFYELEIADIKKKINRLEHCGGESVILENEIEFLTENRTDYLGKKYFQLRDETTLLEETEDTMNKIIKEHKEFLEEHHQEILRRDCEFVRMVEGHKANLLYKKSELLQFEIFSRNSETMLMHFQNDEKQYLEREADQKLELEKMELSLKSYKELVKQDVDRKLLKLSEEFVDKCKETIPKHTQRLIHENIALNNELDRINDTNKKLQTKLDNALNFKSRKQLLEKANHDMVAQCQHNLRKINSLLKGVESMDGIILEYKSMKSLLMSFETLIAEKLTKLRDSKFDVDVLRRDVHALTIEREKRKLDIRLEKLKYDKYAEFKKKIECHIEMLQNFDKHTAADQPVCSFDEQSFQRCAKANLHKELLEMLDQLHYIDDPLEIKINSVTSITKAYTLPNYGGLLDRANYDLSDDDDVIDKVVPQEVVPRKKSQLHKLDIAPQITLPIIDIERAPSVESVQSAIVVDVETDDEEFFFEPSDAELSDLEEDEVDEEDFNYSSSD